MHTIYDDWLRSSNGYYFVLFYSARDQNENANANDLKATILHIYINEIQSFIDRMNAILMQLQQHQQQHPHVKMNTSNQIHLENRFESTKFHGNRSNAIF